jgi:hypothetical protein
LRENTPFRRGEKARILAPGTFRKERRPLSCTGFGGGFGNLYPAYVRGRAYLKAGRSLEASAEFQKILDHRGVVVADPVDALARLQLGRAWALAGDKSKARAAYQDFLTLWKDADREIPILTEAKAEYARLKQATDTAVEAHR